MPYIPDFADPRYLDEVGWFLWHERYERDRFGGSYDEERLAYSRSFMDEVLSYCGRDRLWLEDKTVLSIGCGCTGDLAAWPAAMKVAVDPLLYVYQKLGMLLDDAAGIGRTLYLARGIEDLPLLDECADLVVCRNALDHMPDPEKGLEQIWRILRRDGALFVSVDIGGVPTPDEPTVFSVESLAALLQNRFEVVAQNHDNPPHSQGRDCSVRLLARKKCRAQRALDKAQILQAYMVRLEQLEQAAEGRGVAHHDR
ncbi:MAG TPA: class I SAM-dependent methyltransferase [Candidatus Tectomicrobia bacterium]|jgi:SAM-dependent methyltransferase|nr:class I SAM-dependent methyltransferase [Candidatus Tectomicrobia bacterium]